MKDPIASITVTFNAQAVIAEHLRLLQGQTHRLSEIVVVDNASSDGTLAVLADEFPLVTVLSLPTNVGVGGGYAAGLTYALGKSHQSIWTLDQDSKPEPDCLQELVATAMNCRGNAQPIALFAPRSRNLATGLDYAGFGWRNGVVTLPDDQRAAVQWVDIVISSGSLLSAQAVIAAGLPREDFFMDFVDFEYCLRLRRLGYGIGVVRKAVMWHAVGLPEKRRFLAIPWVWATHVPWREYYKIRNQTFTIWHGQPTFRGKLYLIRKFLRHALAVVIFDPQKFRRLRFMFAGLRDGIRGKLGVVVKPV